MRSNPSLVGLIVDAILDDAALAQIGSELARNLDATSALVQTLGQRGQETISAAIDPAVISGYQAHFWRHDLWVNCKPENTGHVVSVTDEFLHEEDMLDSSIYNDLLKPNSGIFRCAGFVEELSSGEALVVGVHNTRARMFTPENVQLLREVRPLLTGLMTARERLAAGRGHLAERVTDTEIDALMVVTIDGRLTFANRAAVRMLEAGPLNVWRGRVSTNDPQLAFALAAALRDACAKSKGCSLPILGRDLGLHVDPLGGSPPTGSTPGLALVRLRDQAARRTSSVATVATAYHLTPAEARLTELLAAGETLASVALRLGITLHTARNQLKSIFVKTGVRRQVDLFALISQGVC